MNVYLWTAVRVSAEDQQSYFPCPLNETQPSSALYTFICIP